MRIALIPGAGAAVAKSVANWFQLTVAPASQNLTAEKDGLPLEANLASVGWGRSMPQPAARSAAVPSTRVRLSMVPPLVEWLTRHQKTAFTRRCLRVRQLDILYLRDMCAVLGTVPSVLLSGGALGWPTL